MRFINISHNDMDGAGCNIVLREKFKDMESYHVSYNSVKETLEMIDSDITHLTEVLFVTDLAFDKESFNSLMKIAESNPDLKIVYVDHHPYEGESREYFEELKTFDNVYVKHEIGTSATKLCFQLIKSENEDLKKLVDWIDAFDIYKELEDPVNFKVGWFLNTIFWEIKMSGFKTNLINNKYKIPNFFKELYKETVQDKTNYFNKLVDNGLVIFDDDLKLLLSFSDKHKSFWQMDYKQYDYFVLPYHTKGNNISVRFSQRVSEEDAEILRDSIVEYVNQNPWVISAGGHAHAFGITIDQNMDKEEQLSLIQGIIGIIKDKSGV